MQGQQYEEIDPDKPPRTTAIILVLCGLMAVGFLVVNMAFTGKDPYTELWPYEDDDQPIQSQGSVIPNVWRKNQPEEMPEVPKKVKSDKKGEKTEEEKNKGIQWTPSATRPTATRPARP